MRIVTIGGYGFTESDFSSALRNQGVTTLADIRLRRGLRGRRYAFLNSVRLQQSLRNHGIAYTHIRTLAPSPEIREIQKQHDTLTQTRKRFRIGLSPAFVDAYRREVLQNLDAGRFLEELGRDTQVVALFCVEGQPEACHRKLVADWLAQAVGLPVTHIRP